MLRRRSKGEGVRVATRAQFLESLTAETRLRDDWTHVSVLLEVGGDITARWQLPGVDRRRRYRIDDPVGSCPHCAVLECLDIVASHLSISDAARRARDGYLSALHHGTPPCIIFIARPDRDLLTQMLSAVTPDPGTGSGVIVSGSVGDPHTDRDCIEHRRQEPPRPGPPMPTNLAELRALFDRPPDRGG